jgi:3-hydroxy-9,10-secoandrosta-1,3,5(10)-triene-9,17-dione monooxygenase reductase component
MKVPMHHMTGTSTSPRSTTQNTADYRKALSCFATGVTVVSARWQNTDWGMTCNSFSSVSLEPRLVLWSIRKAASSLDAFTQSGGFTVSVLSAQQQSLANQFASGDMAARFEDVSVVRQVSERLRLTEAVAWFDCDLRHLVDAGDHHIVIGQVSDFGWREAPALGFWFGQFGQFQTNT